MRFSVLAGLMFLLACGGDAVRVEGTLPDDCADGADNDGDGAFDCADSSCFGAPVCAIPDSSVDASRDTGLPEAGSDASVDAGTDAEEDASLVDSGGDSSDVDTAETDTSISDAALACSWPPGPYGTRVGHTAAPLSLIDCDGASYEFPNPTLCDVRFTVLSIGAGWCRPCIVETEQFEEEINARYETSDVALLQILVQDEEFERPSRGFCHAWVERFGLSNVVLRDPDQLAAAYFPSGALPSTIIIDNATGTIVFREVGAEEGLTSLRARLDELLAD